VKVAPSASTEIVEHPDESENLFCVVELSLIPTRERVGFRSIRSPKADRLQTEGSFYAKSRYIADDIDLSAKEIGASMRQLQHAPVPVQIEKWAYTNGTTWLISAP